MKNTLVFGFAVLSLLFVLSVQAQEEAVAPPADAQPAAARLVLEQAEKDRPAMKDVTITKKITGRLPNGYKVVVTSTQRDEIYKVQKEYNELIELLKLRIEMMEMERDRRVDALLNEEQVKKLRESRGALESEKKEAQKAQAGTKNRRTVPATEE